MGFFLLLLGWKIQTGRLELVNIKVVEILAIIVAILGILGGVAGWVNYYRARKISCSGQINPIQRDLKKGYEKTPFLKSV
jgi:hypothetical protein